MKKILSLGLALFSTFNMIGAQTVQESKVTDNWFIGIDGGAYLKTTHSDKFGDTRFVFGAKVGRYITPVFGLRTDAQFYMNEPNAFKSKTAVSISNVMVDGLFNFNNLFGGYPGSPRNNEIVGILGIGWAHGFGQADNPEFISTKIGLQLNHNFGASKAWQINIEPAIVYLARGGSGTNVLNINKSGVQITAGISYKFLNSNGTHNFVIAALRDQSEIDALNSKINEQRNAISSLEEATASDQNTIASLRKQLADCEAAPKQVVVNEKKVTTLAPVVIFDQGKSVIKPAQAASVQMIATYMKNHKDSHITIKGYASPEGNKEVNQRISLARANAVKDMLVKKYNISASRLKVVGLGATNDVFDESDWNRVCTFVEE